MFCRIATKTVTTDLFLRAWLFSGCRFIRLLVKVSRRTDLCRVQCVLLYRGNSPPRTWQPANTGPVLGSETLSDRHNTGPKCPGEAFGECVSKCSCIQSPQAFVASCQVWRAKWPRSVWRVQAGGEQMDASRGLYGSDTKSQCLLNSFIFNYC